LLGKLELILQSIFFIIVPLFLSSVIFKCVILVELFLLARWTHNECCKMIFFEFDEVIFAIFDLFVPRCFDLDYFIRFFFDQILIWDFNNPDAFSISLKRMNNTDNWMIIYLHEILCFQQVKDFLIHFNLFWFINWINVVEYFGIIVLY